MNFFIVQLAVADLSTAMVTVLTEIIWKTTVEWHAGNWGCKIVRYLQSVATFAPTYVLVALSIDRLDAIARPMHFTGSATRARALVVSAWVLATVFSTPMWFLNSEKKAHGIKQCWISMPKPWHWKLYVTALALLLLIIPAIIIATCYTVIVCVIWSKVAITGATPKPKHTRIFTKRNGAVETGTEARPNLQGQQSSRGLIPQAKIKTIKMTFVIVIAFVLCWSPYFVFDLLDVYGHIPMSQRKIAVAVFIQSLATLNSAVNPVIYCLFSTRLCSSEWRRSTLGSWLSRKCCRCPAQSGSQRRDSFSALGSTKCTAMASPRVGATRLQVHGSTCSRSKEAGASVPKRSRSKTTSYVTQAEKNNEFISRQVNPIVSSVKRKQNKELIVKSESLEKTGPECESL